jgi:uncharacterized protein YjbI with pentapeptide repeats
MPDAEKPKLKPANDNPWYCLATLYGEQAATGALDKQLAAKNRMAWNRWFAVTLSDDERARLLKNGFPEPELIPLSPSESSGFCDAFLSRRSHAQGLPPKPVQNADFSRTHFANRVSFAGFLFAGRANFSHAAFLGRAHFDSATFSDHAYFNSAVFAVTSNFSYATFSRDVLFSDAIFTESTFFDYATFSRYAEFESTAFSGLTYFRSAKFVGEISFTSSTFAKNVTFSNAEFAANTFFSRAHFEAEVPDFRGAKMHEATELHGVNWPRAPQNKYEARTQVYAYERLKQEMERLKKHEDEQSFFRKELRARRGLVSRWSGAWLLNYAYEVCSNYGQSILRPMLWLLVLFAIGGAVFVVFPVLDGARMAASKAAVLSFANIFSFLPIKREIMTPEMIKGLSSAAQIVGVLQSLLGIVLLFLLGLALRSRFRMR